MLPLFDMMMKAQDGEAMRVMAQQFGLAQEQMVKATAALMPAFSTALNRNAANPYDFSTFLTSMSNGAFAGYFEDMTKAFTPKGVADGNDILGQLFGSKEMSRAIAAHAAQMTGLGQEIFKQMMPVMASAMIGGLFKQSMGQMPGAQNPSAQSMAAMMQSFLDAAGFATKPEGAANPFAQAMQGFFGAGATEGQPMPAADLFASNPFLKAFQEMMPGNGNASPQSASTGAMAEMFKTMFDSGLAAQKDYQKTIDGLFATYNNKPPQG